MKNKKAFTLIELLAVIIILAIILVIAVPKISNAIEKSKKGVIESSAKLIERDLERKYESSFATGSVMSVSGSCMDGLNTNEYSDCAYEIDNNGKAHVTLTGASTGKFKGLVYMDGTAIKMQKVTITFNNNGGTNSTTTKEVLVGNKYGSLPLPTKSNNAFLGWYLDSELTNKVTSKTIVSNEVNHTLYAKYGTTPILSRSWADKLTAANSSITKETIGSVTFHDTSVGLTLSGTPVDVSSSTIAGTGSTNGSVLAYYKLNNSLYDIDIVAESTIYFPSSSKTLFQNLMNVFELNFNNSIDTSNVTNMSYMFEGAGCKSVVFTLNISCFDTSNVTDMAGMFNSTGSKTTTFMLDVSHFDTSNVTIMKNMFMYTGYESTTLEIFGLENFDTSNVTDMQGMFEYAGYESTSFSLDVSHFDTSNVTDMAWMFCSTGRNSTTLEIIGLENFDTSNVTDMYSMFYYTGCNSTTITLDVSHFDTSKVEDMSCMFRNTGFKSTNFNTSITILNPNTTYANMFYNAITVAGSQITVNYTAETESLVDAMIATKSSGSNVVKGSLITN